MKFGDMKYDVPFESFNKDKCDFTNFEYWRIKNEGKRLYKKYPKYKYLKEDPRITKRKEFDENNFYYSVVYAYIIEHLLRQHPELNEMYQGIIQKDIGIYKRFYPESTEKIYGRFNRDFLDWYQDYLREQADPGILEREHKEWEAKNKALQAAHDARKRQEQQQLQQDLANGTRVVCPYCKSADTKKISVASRAVSVSLVGAASGKIGKQWHCNHCGSDF